MGNAATFLTIEAGDWLQAGSGILGVGLTVLVTLWIERRNRIGTQRNDFLRVRKQIGMQLRLLKEAADEVRRRQNGNASIVDREDWLLRWSAASSETSFTLNNHRPRTLVEERAIENLKQVQGYFGAMTFGEALQNDATAEAHENALKWSAGTTDTARRSLAELR